MYIDNVLKKSNIIFIKILSNWRNGRELLLAQSIGEPLTQFTLNTFHSTGSSSAVGGMDGIKRFLEIINITKNQKVPITTIYMTDEYKYEKKNAEILSQKLKYIKLEDLLESYDIIFDETKERIKRQDIKKIQNCFWIKISKQVISIHIHSAWFYQKNHYTTRMCL